MKLNKNKELLQLSLFTVMIALVLGLVFLLGYLSGFQEGVTATTEFYKGCIHLI